MHHITFTPVRADSDITLSVEGDTLIRDGEALDLSGIPEGESRAASTFGTDWFEENSVIVREDGDLHYTLILPHGSAAPHERRYPQPIVMTPGGAVPLPPYEAALADDEGEADVERRRPTDPAQVRLD